MTSQEILATIRGMKLNQLFNSGFIGDGLAILSGALLTLAFAPYGLYPLAILMPAMLYGLWYSVSAKRAFWRGWLFGVGLFTSGVYWIFISINTYGGTTPAVAIIITCLFVAILGLFPAFSGYLLNRYYPNTDLLKLFCGFPLTWVAIEWVRSWVFSGFPWLIIGYSQTASPLRGYAPLMGVFGVSLAVLFSSALVVNIVLSTRAKRYRVAFWNLFAFLFIWLIGGLFSMITWTTPFGSALKVSLVQGDIAQEIKWSEDYVQSTLDHYVELSKNHWDSDILIWPESAIPVSLSSAQDFVDALDQLAKQHQTTFITGIPIKVEDQDSYYNAVIALGNSHDFYLKHRLVPFGEYVPLQRMLHGMLEFINVPMSNFIPAKVPPKLLQIGKIKLAVFICYEIAFPEQVRYGGSDLNMLLTVNNDAWFGKSIAQAQHLEMAQMRAFELQRPVLFVSNNGLTAIVAASGKIQAQVPPYQSAVLTDSVQPTSGKTPWQRVGMNPFILILFALVLITVRVRRGP